jgi:hypothetical protein
MKSLNTKLVLSALAVAMIASPAFAQRPHRQLPYPYQSQYQAPLPANGIGVYPNPVPRTGSAWSVQSGAAFNTGY